jgi:FkbH-like protein
MDIRERKSKMRVLLLSNINMRPLVSQLAPWEATCGSFNSMLADLATTTSAATAPDVSHVVCMFDTDTLLGDALYGAGSVDQCDLFLAALDTFCERHPEKVVVTNTFCVSSNRWLGFADFHHEASLKNSEMQLNARLAAMARVRLNLLVLDLDILFRRHGEDSLISNAFWYVGRVRYTAKMFDLLGQTIKRAVNAHAQKSRKVLALDLDNTLWGGIVGEVGALGITLGDDGTGRCFRDFQRALKAIRKTGVLLVIVSKNNASDVDEVFEKNKMMVLNREDFVMIHANWQSKAENLVAIADALNLGVDSFVFIDDNPVEREEVTRFLPEIMVPTFPSRPEDLTNWFFREVVSPHFGKYVITPEDSTKTEQYCANEARRKMAMNFDLDGYLAQLGIECSISVDMENQLVRAAQMTQKTNQFNLTTRRYEVTDLARFLHSSQHAVLMLEYRDRFGDEGSVALAIVDLAKARIDTFLTSCRVIGRKVEDRLLDKAIELCRERGHRKIIGEYIPSRKNQVVADFYDTHGFAPVGVTVDGCKMYERSIDARP